MSCLLSIPGIATGLVCKREKKKVEALIVHYKEQKIVTNHGTALLLMHLKPPSTPPNHMGV